MIDSGVVLVCINYVFGPPMGLLDFGFGSLVVNMFQIFFTFSKPAKFDYVVVLVYINDTFESNYVRWDYIGR